MRRVILFVFVTLGLLWGGLLAAGGVVGAGMPGAGARPPLGLLTDTPTPTPSDTPTPLPANTATSSPYLGLIEHWDGTSWSIVPNPNPGTGANIVYGVAAVSATDIWAVGGYGDGSTRETLAAHWNGTSWSVIPSPNTGIVNELLSVAAVSTTDVWAVGFSYNGSATQPLVEHYTLTCP